MPQAYLVLYAADGSLLMCQKVARSYFFGTGTQGQIYVNGVAPNGANNYALPGGRMNAGETAAQAAVREFNEELALPLDAAHVTPVQLQDPQGNQFWAVYAQSDTVGVEWAASYAHSRTLPAAAAIAKAIRAREIGSYDRIPPWAQAHRCEPWPNDNEMADAYFWNVTDQATWQLIQSWNGNPTIGWYYIILSYLRTQILHIP